MSGAIRTNEVGYVAGATKVAVVVNSSTTGLAFKVVSATGTCSDTGVFSGTTTVFGNDPAAGDFVHQADFSALTTPGSYKLCVGTDESYPFAIGSTVYNTLPKHALKYFYFARTGKLETQYLTDFASAAHARIALRPNDSAIASYLGWTTSTFNVKDFHMDAGDVATYGENHAMGMWLLLNLFETFKTSAASYNLNIPPVSALPLPLAAGTPDILNEISYSANAAMSMLQCTPGAGSAVTCVSGTTPAALGAHKVGHYNWFPYVKNSWGDWGMFTPWREAYCDFADINNVPPNGNYAGNGIQATFSCTTDADCTAGGAVFQTTPSPICLTDSHQCRNDCQSHLLRQVSKPSTGATLGYVRYLAHLARLLYPYDSTRALQFWAAAEDAYNRAKTIPFRHYFSNMTEPMTDPNASTQNAAYYSAANLTPWAKKACSDANCGTGVNVCTVDADCMAEKSCTTDADCDQGSACISSKCKWDYNGDGVVNSSDVTPLAKCLPVTAYEMPSTVSGTACVYDYDGNGVIDSNDWTSPRGTGPYDDPSIGDDRYAAAAEMYLTAYALNDSTKATYKTDLTSNIYYPNGATGHKGVERGDWSADALFGTISLLTAPNDLTAADVSALTSKFTAYADFERNAIETQGYPSAIPPHANIAFGWPDAEGPDDTAGDGDAGEYRWGSNKDQAYAGMVLVQAYRLTGNAVYLRDAYRMMDYLLGTNPMGASYVTGWGANSYLAGHHRHALYSAGVNGAAYPKGWLLGGPISTSMICGYDETVTPKGPGVAKAKHMPPIGADFPTAQNNAENAWCSEEVTIDWNGGLAWLAYALDQVYSTTLGGSCTPETDAAFCSRLAKNCGSVTANDNCGSARTVTSCGTCTSPATCGGGGTANVCGTSTCSCPDDGNPCTVDACDTNNVCQHTAGNAGTVCRASAGACDVAETCTGTSTTCPADGFAPSSTVCRASAGACDVAENCTGTSSACPADAFASSSTVCRAAAGACDNAENCTGTSSACPADAFKASGTVCRASAGVCDVAETCNGTSAACPADAFASSSTVCRSATGTCDVAENCSGTSTSCPADGFAPSGTACTGGTCNGSGTCVASCTPETDAAFCTRLGKNCGSVTANDNCGSARTVASCGTCTSPATCGGGGTANVCGTASTDPCSTPVVITGSGTYTVNSTGTCFQVAVAANVNGIMPTVMNSGTGNTTVTWYGGTAQTVTACAQTSQNLSGNGAQINNFVVGKDSVKANAGNARFTVKSQDTNSYSVSVSFQTWGNGSGCSSPAPSGGCTCADDGNPCTVDACDANGVCQHTAGNAGAVCRASAGACDVAETCTGTSTTCPADGFAPSTTVCRASAGTCDVAENCTGTSAACPADGFAPSTTVCRAAAGTCDNAENCTGTSAACPADTLKASGTVCRAAAGVCDVAETCNGTSAACPADALAPSTTVCRAATGTCDVAENCTGTATSCPTDAFAPSGTACTGGTCNGSGTCVTCTLPAAPTGFTATAGAEAATLSWTAVTGATSYTVSRSTTSGGPYTSIATGVTSTTYVNTVASGTYYYVVAAVSSCGTGANSAQASASPTNVAPTASISAPANNATFTAPASVSITANASDTSFGSISKVEFYQGTTLLGTDTATPYTFTWSNVAAGTYSLTVKAYDNLNAVTTSAAVSITVSAGGTTPCAGLCSNPVVFTTTTFNSGNLGSGATCHEFTGTLNGSGFGNFVAPRTLSVNGTNMGSAGGSITLPAKRNGGYCFQATAGSYDWAYFSTW